MKTKIFLMLILLSVASFGQVQRAQVLNKPKLDSLTVSASKINAIAKTVPKVYRALISQSDTLAPVPTVLENTIGEIVFTRSSTGTYTATLAGAFPRAKTIVLMQNTNWAGSLGYSASVNVSEDAINLSSYDLSAFLGVSASPHLSDGSFDLTSFEILVYQ